MYRNDVFFAQHDIHGSTGSGADSSGSIGRDGSDTIDV